jgi:hypothetical protein
VAETLALLRVACFGKETQNPEQTLVHLLLNCTTTTDKMNIIISISILAFVFIGSSVSQSGLCFPSSYETSSNVYLSETFNFPVYQNYSLAQPTIHDNTSQWMLTLGTIVVYTTTPYYYSFVYFDAFLNSTTNYSRLGASAEVDVKLRASPEYGWLTIKGLTFPGYVSNITDYAVPQNASYNVSISFAEFRTKNPPDTLQTIKYTNREAGSNCTILGTVSIGSNTFEQFKPFTLELIFYDGRHLWFDVPLSSKYSAYYSRSGGTETYSNCPDCASANEAK